MASVYDVIDSYVHDTEQWIQGFMLGDLTILIDLLPSPKIVVKYYQPNNRQPITNEQTLLWRQP